jgi:septal ring factor EnvC (AmiA/AmiB activator)
MSFANLLILANFIALLVVTFVLWSAIKSTKRQVMSQLNRELAEVRRQMRTSMKSVDRLYDHVTDNHERILKIEVNLVNTQDELEYIGGKIKEMQNFSDASAPNQEQVPDDERKHIYD